MEKGKKMKLYVWEDFTVYTDRWGSYYNGLAFAIAENSKEAKRLLKEKVNSPNAKLIGDLTVYSLTDKKAFYVLGDER